MPQEKLQGGTGHLQEKLRNIFYLNDKKLGTPSGSSQLYKTPHTMNSKLLEVQVLPRDTSTSPLPMVSPNATVNTRVIAATIMKNSIEINESQTKPPYLQSP